MKRMFGPFCKVSVYEQTICLTTAQLRREQDKRVALKSAQAVCGKVSPEPCSLMLFFAT